jgi:hypothetical protein
MKHHKPIASLSFDVDNQWSYMKTHGDSGWKDFPSYLDIVIPRVLTFLKERNLTITFFIVGQDVDLEKNHAAIRMISEAGHEIGNHSFYHEPWLHKYTEEQIETDLQMAEKLIVELTGQKPKGFRGPGYSLSETALKVLARNGYIYDASTLPTFIGPLARMYYFMRSKFSIDEQEERDLLFGTWRDGLRSIRPYSWRIDGNRESGKSLIEIPVTTMPIFKVPFHVSYLLFLTKYSHKLAMLYFKFALLLCRLSGTHPSLLIHPLDFLGCDDIQELNFFPAMDITHKEKIQMVRDFIDVYIEHYCVVSLHEYAIVASQSSHFPSIKPSFSTTRT